MVLGQIHHYFRQIHHFAQTIGAGLLVKNLRNLGLESHCLEGSPEASAHWPTTQDNYSQTYYHVVNLLTDQAREVMPVTDYVVSFEVAEHIQPYYTDKFIALLSMHKPKRIIFGAATVDQDRGLNPTHVNEREFDYWIKKFSHAGYVIDLAKTAKLKHDIITDQNFMIEFGKLWFFPKNVLVFESLSYTTKEELNTAREQLPVHVNMLDPVYTQLGYSSRLNSEEKEASEFGIMWERDWIEFGNLFHAKSESGMYEVYA